MLRLRDSRDHARAVRVRVYDAPRQVGMAREVLAVDDVPDAPDRHAKNTAHRGDIRALRNVGHLAEESIQPGADGAADERSVDGDAARVYADDVDEVVIEGTPVLDDVEGAGADDSPDHQAERDIVDRVLLVPLPPSERGRHRYTNDDAKRGEETVPGDLDTPIAKDYWVDANVNREQHGSNRHSSVTVRAAPARRA